jgi:hypothetical protein
VSKPEQIAETISAFYTRLAADPYHRYRSWEHCYQFFKSRSREEILGDSTSAGLQLGFYLASWGMYRGSSFLLQRTYTVHEAVVQRLAGPEFDELWNQEVGASDANIRWSPLILKAVDAVREGYSPFGHATDTLVTKVLLGTVACLPAVDRFFVDGFKTSGHQYSSLNERFVRRILEFSAIYQSDLRTAQLRILSDSGTHYPMMKLADMFFWELGYKRDQMLGKADDTLSDL